MHEFDCSSASLVKTFKRSQVRLLDRLPPPQFLEHSDQGPQGDHCSVTGQSWRLQNSITVDGPGHGFPSSSSGFSGFSGSSVLDSGMRQVLERWVVPPPQLLLQLDHSSHSVHSGFLTQGSSLQLELSLLSPAKAEVNFTWRTPCLLPEVLRPRQQGQRGQAQGRLQGQGGHQYLYKAASYYQLLSIC